MANPAGSTRKPGARDTIVRFVRRRWLVIILVIAVVVFVAQNRKHASIDILWIHIRSPLWFILAVTAVVGLVIGLIIARHRSEARGHRDEASS
jgi:uncharacterized integral membrane protein